MLDKAALHTNHVTACFKHATTCFKHATTGFKHVQTCYQHQLMMFSCSKSSWSFAFLLHCFGPYECNVGHLVVNSKSCNLRCDFQESIPQPPPAVNSSCQCSNMLWPASSMSWPASNTFKQIHIPNSLDLSITDNFPGFGFSILGIFHWHLEGL